MFKIVKKARAWWPVEFQLPGEDGQLVDQKFELRFRLLKVDEAIEFIRDAAKVEATESDALTNAAIPVAEGDTQSAPTSLAELYAGLVERVADDWRGVQAENGTELPWTKDNLVVLLNETGMFRRISAAFQECLGGRDRIRAGN